MRLIDVDALLEELSGFSVQITGNNAMASVAMEETKKSIAKMIAEQPTAYDVDKVVEQLEEWSKAYDDPVSSDHEFRRHCHGIAEGYRLAIDIVKAGGVE